MGQRPRFRLIKRLKLALSGPGFLVRLAAILTLLRVPGPKAALAAVYGQVDG